MQDATAQRPHQRLIYAHRGANPTFPENSLEAFELGLASGANALELDVHRTKDDSIVVFHDENGLRVANEPARIKDTALSEIRKWRLSNTNCKVPTLVEVIEAFPFVPINVDIKAHDPKTVFIVIEQIAAMRASDRVRLTSASHKIIRLIHKLGYSGPTGLSALEIVYLYFLPSTILKALRFSNRAAQIPIKISTFRLDTPDFIWKCHALGLRVDYWTINNRQTANYLWEIGADGVMTDDPSQII